MRLSGYWPASIRIIEFGGRNSRTARQLLRSGYRSYLGVVGKAKTRGKVARRHPQLADRVLVANSPRQVRQNNAEVLVLHGWSWLHLLRFRNVRHAGYIAWSVRRTPSFAVACLLALTQCVLGRLRWPVVLGDGQRDASAVKFIVFRVRKPRPHSAVRRFVPHELGMVGFLQRLQTEGVRHVVLRWFESLPELPRGEDLDLLIDDASLEKVRAILDEGPGVQPVDLYSVTGLPGADFRGMPYYPPYLAEQLLDGARSYQGLCLAPSTREHFLSLAYHALYHKGFASGLLSRSRTWRTRRVPDHNYAMILHDLCRQLRLVLPITLENLDQYLDSQGWRPPHDMLVRLSRRNGWIRSLICRPEEGSFDNRLAVFLLRQEALARGGMARAEQLLEQHGFHIVESLTLEPGRIERIAKSLRGGNWGRGPWPISGGPPVAAIVTYDPQPITPNRRQRKRFPFLANGRLLAKEQIRDAFNLGLPPTEHCNVVHSSDNGREAIDYLRVIAPDDIDAIFSRTRLLTQENSAVGEVATDTSRAA